MKTDSVINQQPAPLEDELQYPIQDYPCDAHGWRWIAKTLARDLRTALRVAFPEADAARITQQVGHDLPGTIFASLVETGIAETDSFHQAKPLAVFCHVPQRQINSAFMLTVEKLQSLGLLELATIAVAERRLKVWLVVHPLPEAADSAAS